MPKLAIALALLLVIQAVESTPQNVGRPNANMKLTDETIASMIAAYQNLTTPTQTADNSGGSFIAELNASLQVDLAE